MGLKEVHIFSPHFHEKEYYHGHIHHPQGGLIIPNHAVVPDSPELHPHVFDTNLELMSADYSLNKIRSGKSTRKRKSSKRNSKKNKVKKLKKMKNKKLIRKQKQKLKEKISKIENVVNKLADKKIMTNDMKLKDAKMITKDNKMMMKDMKTKDVIVKDTIAKKDTKN